MMGTVFCPYVKSVFRTPVLEDTLVNVMGPDVICGVCVLSLSILFSTLHLSFSTARPMSSWNKDALVSLRERLQVYVLMETGFGNRLEKAAGGFLSYFEACVVREQSGNTNQIQKVIEFLLGKTDEDFVTFLEMLRASNNKVWADELERIAKAFKEKQVCW